MEHKFLRLFKDGVWTGREDRMIRIDGEEHDMDVYAKKHGIVLPDSKGGKKPKKEINIDEQEESYGDMEEKIDEGDSSVD
jgi:hypothetical protein